MTFQYTIQLLSPTVIASGDSEVSTVDIDSQYDQWGLPWLPSKRLKGVLREVAEEQMAAGLLTHDDLIHFFGTDKQSGQLTIGNGYLPDYKILREAIESYEMQKDLKRVQIRSQLIENWTQTRAMIRLDGFGVAEDNSLRFLRALDPSQVPLLEGTIVLKSQRSGDFDKLNHLFLGLKRLGSSRNRGFGKVRAALSNVEKQSQNQLIHLETNRAKDAQKNDLMCLTYVLRAEAPLVLTSLEGQYGKSESYITGTQIRGALAGLFVQHGKFDAFEEAFLRSDQVVFGQAYPMGKGHMPWVPSPLNFRIEKYGQGQVKDLRPIDTDDHSHLETKDLIFKSMKAWTDGKKDQEVISLAMSHHARPEDRGKGTPHSEGETTYGELYAFEAIDEGQRFYGTITGPKVFLDEVRQMLIQTGKLAIGKSVNAQYGQLEIEALRYSMNQEIHEAVNVILDQPREQFDLVLTSPLMMMNEWGSVGPYMPYLKQVIESQFDGIELHDAYLGIKTIGGYNALWRAPRGSVTVLNQGSVLCFKCSGKPIAPSVIIQYIQQEVCTRGNEGYNQMALLDRSLEAYAQSVIQVSGYSHDLIQKIENPLPWEALKQIKGFGEVIQ